MTKHEHAEMIKAKADNMDLVVFMLNASDHGWLKVSNNWQLPHFYEGQQYFLCHPKHERECLHWLNDGEVYLVSEINKDRMLNEDRMTVVSKGEYGAWRNHSYFMNESYDFRIKPRKEKRWIVVKNGMLQSNHLFKSDNEAAVVCGFGGQFIEIEVEV